MAKAKAGNGILADPVLPEMVWDQAVALDQQARAVIAERDALIRGALIAVGADLKDMTHRYIVDYGQRKVQRVAAPAAPPKSKPLDLGT